MSFLVIPNTTLTDPADKTEVEANFAAVKTIINGNLGSDNISELSVDKLSGNFYNHFISFSPLSLASLGNVTIPVPTGTWTIVLIGIHSDDVGDGAGTCLVEEGSWNGSGVFTATKTSSTKTVTSGASTISLGSFTGSTTGSSSVAYRLSVTGAAASTPGEIYVTVVLKRKIHT